MNRTIEMIGKDLLYEEMHRGSVADDGRKVVMDGENVRYREVADVATVEEKTVVAEVAEAETVGVLPECLATEQALRYWQRLREAGFVDKCGKLLSTTTRQQACTIADEFAKKVGLEQVKWKVFQTYWNISNLAQDWSHSRTNNWNPARCDEIKEIFNDKE